jgi:hypothetical protein
MVTELMKTLTVAKAADERTTAASEIAGIVKQAGVVKGLKTLGVLDTLKKSADDKKNPIAREAAMEACKSFFWILVLFELLNDRS